MRIGVFSDSHGDISYAKRFFNRIFPLDSIIHLGDYASDGEKLGKLFSCPAYTVRGNCDYSSDAPMERQLEFCGKRLLLMHGHQFYPFSSILYRGEEVRADLVLYGHTHVPSLSADGSRLFLNPGSLSLPRGGSAESCALILLDNSDFHIRFINADNGTDLL